MNEYALLDWDSKFFGFQVGKIIPRTLDASRLGAVLADLRRENVSLVYWASDSCSLKSKAAGNSLGGLLVDRRTTYLLDLETLDMNLPQDSNLVVEYRGRTANEALEQLAIQSGKYSRFNVDPRITRDQFEALYRMWIRKSIKKTMADVVMVIEADDGKIAGMVTLGEKGVRGDIGLIAVDTPHRGKGYGCALINSALRFFLSKGYRYSQVVTQGDNAPACSLYEAVGYKVETRENFFHFWLD